jgi:hypothetical protein
MSGLSVALADQIRSCEQENLDPCAKGKVLDRFNFRME